MVTEERGKRRYDARGKERLRELAFKKHYVTVIGCGKPVERLFFIRQNVSNDGFSDFQSLQTPEVVGQEKCNNETIYQS